MPGKLKLLVALLGLGVVTDALALALGGQGSYVRIAVGLALIFGVFKGSEGTRTLLLLAAWLGLAFGALRLVLGVIAFGALVSLADDPVMHPDTPGGALVLIFLAAFGTAQSAFFLWCLRRIDVQDWMFRRSMLGEAE